MKREFLPFLLGYADVGTVEMEGDNFGLRVKGTTNYFDIESVNDRSSVYGFQEVVVADCVDKHRYYLSANENGGYQAVRISKDEWFKKIVLDRYFRVDRFSTFAFGAGMATGAGWMVGQQLLFDELVDMSTVAVYMAKYSGIIPSIGLLLAAVWNANHYLERSGGLKGVIERYGKECEKLKDEEVKSFFGSGEFARMMHSREMAQILAMLTIVAGFTALQAVIAHSAPGDVGAGIAAMAVAIIGSGGAIVFSDEIGLQIKAFGDKLHRQDNSADVAV